jgi:hypothetical protein
MPIVELKQRRLMNKMKYLILDCRVTSNPLERVVWWRNGRELQLHESGVSSGLDLTEDEFARSKLRFETHDISNINEYFKTLVTLTISVSLITFFFSINKFKLKLHRDIRKISKFLIQFPHSSFAKILNGRNRKSHFIRKNLRFLYYELVEFIRSYLNATRLSPNVNTDNLKFVCFSLLFKKMN